MKINLFYSNGTDYLWYILIFSMLSFPRIFQIPKSICLIILLFITLRSPIRLKRNYKRFIFLWLLYHLYISIVGILRNNSFIGIIGNFRVNIIYVMILMIIAQNRAKKKCCFFGIIKTIYFAGLYIALFNITLVFLTYMGFDSKWMSWLDATAIVGIHEGYSHIVTTNLSMSIVLFPLMLMLLEHNIIKHYIGKNNAFLSTLLMAIAMVLSGRRILWIVLLVSTFVYFFVYFRKLQILKRNIVLGIIILTVGITVVKKIGVLDVNGMITRFTDAFATKSAVTGYSNIRIIQMKALIDGFLKNPIFGSGSAGTLENFYRNVNQKWSFELSYHVVVFNGGVIGSFLYFGSLFCAFLFLIDIRKKDKVLYIALLLSFSLCIFANGTNPYFSSSFDFLSMLFLPIYLRDCVQKYDNQLLNSFYTLEK